MQNPEEESHNLASLKAYNKTETKCDKMFNMWIHTLSMSQPYLLAECEM